MKLTTKFMTNPLNYSFTCDIHLYGSERF